MLKWALYSLLLAWFIAWAVSLWSALSRPDLAPVPRLTWVLVLIFVLCLGLLFYWLLTARVPPREVACVPTSCGHCGSRLPEGASTCATCGTPVLRI